MPAVPTNEIKYLTEQPFVRRTVSRTRYPTALVKAPAPIIPLAFSTTALAEYSCIILLLLGDREIANPPFGIDIEAELGRLVADIVADVRNPGTKR